MIWLSILLVTISFIGGTVFSSFKLSRTAAPEPPPAGTAPAVDFDTLKTRALENKQNANVWTQLGNAYFDAGQYQNAIDAYEKSVAIDPGNPDVLTDLGVMYRRSNQPEKAVEMFSRAMAADPGHEVSRMNKGIVLLHDLNDKSEAMKAWKGLLEINPLATFGNGQSVDRMVWEYEQERK
ncbi:MULTISPECIES: tetratricopeptide repeat protein [Desulfobacter]|uniref:tetratricopeptide repeat protein n=1 Tax=Desulfobacter TaxID=2289 RepID=UPI000A0543AF|nr:tetratricopeptide repeat protein [Desulfobacter vibrioformis]